MLERFASPQVLFLGLLWDIILLIVWTNYLDFDCVVESQAYHLCAVYRNAQWFSIVYFIQILTSIMI
jgi:hypothetical protein